MYKSKARGATLFRIVLFCFYHVFVLQIRALLRAKSYLSRQSFARLCHSNNVFSPLTVISLAFSRQQNTIASQVSLNVSNSPMNEPQLGLSLPPLSLYIHIPWCVKKCPYCDFNSHQGEPNALPISDYVEMLKKDLINDAHWAQHRKLGSIFFGGGTPSLMPNDAIAHILEFVHDIVGIAPEAEITLEANPGTVEHHNFGELRATGVNRLSLGVQSFEESHLQKLGRIHSASDAQTAVKRAQDGGFSNINIDLMHGLPNQNINQALSDLDKAISLAPQHISWYQLTIEQNTVFYSQPPTLPEDDILADIYDAGHARLAQAGFNQYEISAYCQAGKASAHNMNYWTFGDYLAIGAGAHGKITTPDSNEIIRFQKTRLPKDYLDSNTGFTSKTQKVETAERTAEFMMNALRLTQGVDKSLFQSRTGLPIESISEIFNSLEKQGLLNPNPDTILLTPKGGAFLNSVLEQFIDL